MTSEQPSGNAASSQPEHELIDFAALAAQLTNEQKILACLERIEVLLTPASGASQAPSKAQQEHAEKIKALQDRVPSGRRK